MKILIINGVHGKTTSLHLSTWMKAALSVCLVGMPMAVGWWIGHYQASHAPAFFEGLVDAWQAEIEDQRGQVVGATAETNRHLRALNNRLSELQSRLVRMEALGALVADRANLSVGEFDFSAPVAIGGPASAATEVENTTLDLEARLRALDIQLSDRSLQLELLAAVMFDRQMRELASPSGLPVTTGWISSRYGMRADPFSGDQAWHGGIDIAGREGAPVLAVASGVVTFAGYRPAYGNVVEITHDSELVTLYAHHREILVEAGAIVRKGDTIATIGSTGRSTGPHVHFEVYKNGRSVDPSSYINRTIR